MAQLIGFALLAIAIGIFIVWKQNYLKKIRAAETVYVRGADKRYADLALQNYGIPIRIERGRANVVFPRLTPTGDVEYIYSWHYLSDLKLPVACGDQEQDIRLDAAIELAAIIHEHLYVEAEMDQLRQQYHQVDRLADLIATSQVYSDQLDLYERAIDQINACLSKARDLQNLYVHLIREALIGIKISSYNPAQIRGDRLQFEAQSKRLRAELQHMRDTATEYHRLLQEKH